MVKRAVWIMIAAIGLIGCQHQVKQDSAEQASTPKESQSVSAVVQEVTLPDGKLTPDDVLRFLNAKQRSSTVDLWQRLRIDKWYWGYRKAEKFEFEIGKADKLAVIQLADPGNIPDVRYLFFKNKGGMDWHFVSYFDDLEQQYGPLEHQVEFAGEQVWFVVKSLGAHGSGLSWHNWIWLSLNKKEAKPVLYIPDYCESYIGTPVIYETWAIKQKGLVGGKYIVKATGRFTWSSLDEEIFSKEDEYVYVWNPQKDTFYFDRRRSTVAESAWDKYLLKEEAGFSRSLKLYCADLLKVANKGNPHQKAWLKNYLESLAEKSACRNQLLRVLKSG
jgi:hypothetical protein